MSRSSLQITASVWHALLLREAVARLFGRRWAAVWLLVEPLAGIGFLLAIYATLRARHIGGMDTLLWLSSGLLAFYLFRRTAGQGAASIGANQALYTYRQVQPVDTVITRCILEGLINVAIGVIVMFGLLLVNVQLAAHAPLMIMASLLGLWLLGLGWGLCVSVATELIPELGKVLSLMLRPLMFISGVIFPLAAIPYPWREWIMWNPVAHGVEGVRAGISQHYHHAVELDMFYLFQFGLAAVFLGLALQLRFRYRLVSL